MKKKDLYITQNSYFFIHRYFLKFFKDDFVEVVFVRERNRGILKKYLEIIYYFGLLNFLVCVFGEIKYFLKFNRELTNIKFEFVDDSKLNYFILKILKSGKYRRVFSVGCPCLIDHTLQDQFSIPIYNLHGGILPFQRGRFSPLKSIKLSHKFLGSSLHLINENFDKGKILSQDYYEYSISNRLLNYTRVLELSANLLEDFLNNKKRSLPKKIINYFIKTIK